MPFEWWLVLAFSLLGLLLWAILLRSEKGLRLSVSFNPSFSTFLEA
ncbi:MAG: hypothetical protein N3F67_03090 [Acidilobaceae archaeon]|nr:hypothetical protein [Acidilobaceae archaeon]